MHQVTDVEAVKKKVRRLAAGQVLAGGGADVCLDLALMEGCQVHIAAGYRSLSDAPQTASGDSLIWILDGYAEVHDAAGRVTDVRQGESAVLRRGTAYRLVFPTLTIYLRVEAEGAG